MKGSVCIAAFLAFLLLLPAVTSAGRHIRRLHSRNAAMVKPDAHWERRPMKQRRPDTLQIAGSRLPDCLHACGSCSPCRLVMVSFVCAKLEEAETCPIAYKCMCKNKSYPVP